MSIKHKILIFVDVILIASLVQGVRFLIFLVPIYLVYLMFW